MRRFPGASAVLAAALLLTACGTSSATTAGPTGSPPESSLPGSVPGHIHGLATDPGSGDLLVATHAGLFSMDDAGTAERIGEELDLMGFTAGPEGTFYASGHPGPGSGLPGPLGLVRSGDGGKTWSPLSRQGESDFHALAASADGVAAFDGQLRFSPDGKEWADVPAGFQPARLAGSPSGRTVLATTEQGVQRSADGGRTWTAVAGSPIILLAAFADAQTAVGVTPDGAVHLSKDGGLTWKRVGSVGGQPAAVAAGDRTIWVAVGEQILASDDGGKTFAPLGDS